MISRMHFPEEPDLGSGFSNLNGPSADSPVHSDGNTVFIGNDNSGKAGIVLHDGTSVRTVADTDDIAPGLARVS